MCFSNLGLFGEVEATVSDVNSPGFTTSPTSLCMFLSSCRHSEFPPAPVLAHIQSVVVYCAVSISTLAVYVPNQGREAHYELQQDTRVTRTREKLAAVAR